MEIVNLRSPVSPDRVLETPKDVSGPYYEVTNLKPGVKNPNRVNVFLDGQFAFSLDLTQVLDAKLKLGAKLSPAERQKLEHASEFGKLYARTLEWVLVRPRSVREARDHLRLKRFQKSYTYTDDDIEAVISRLVAKNYVNDESFARWFIENRNLKKGVSRRRLEQELAGKGIDKSLIEELLNASPRSDESEIKKVIIKKAKTSTPEKLLRYLLSHGFPYDASKSLVEAYFTDPDTFLESA